MRYRYDWEDGVEPFFVNEINQINDKMPDSFPYAVIGVAVANVETGEAAFVDNMLGENEVAQMDLLRDVLEDVTLEYEHLLKEDDQ